MDFKSSRAGSNIVTAANSFLNSNPNNTLMYRNVTSNMQTSQQTFSFPILETSELISSFQELGILYITEDVILNPDKSKELIRRLLEHLAEICIGISRDELSQPTFSGLNALSYPELHDDSIPFINSYRACCKLMEICGINKFSLQKDYCNPTHKRLKRQLSGIINFAKFREERLILLNELESSKKELNDKLNSETEKNEQLTKRCTALREQAASETKMITKIENDCKDIERKISELNVKQNLVRDESTQLKSVSNKLKDSIAEKTSQFNELTSMKMKLSNQIVSSPERFRKQIVDVGLSLKSEQSETKLIEKKLREMTTWLDNINDAQREIDFANESVHELKNEVDKQKSLLFDVDSIQSKLNTKRQAFLELDANVLELGRQVARRKDKLGFIQNQSKSRGEDTQKTIDELHKQLIDADGNRHQTRLRADKIEADLKSLQRETDAEKTEMDQVRNLFIMNVDIVTC